MHKSHKLSGFTLVEAMIALSIGLALAGAAIWFLVQGTRISLRTAAASTNDLSEWGILASVTLDTKIANGMVMYSDYNKDTLADINNRLDEAQPSKQYGNVLILSQSHQAVNEKEATYEQITGYVFDPTYQTFKKFTYKVTTDEQKSTLETILVNHFKSATLRPVATGITGGCPPNAASGGSKTAFACRKAGRSGNLCIQISNGYGKVRTDSNKIIETSFYIRS